MPEPQEILDMCEDLFMSRQDGELTLERDIYKELIEIFRSPETIIAITKPKVKQD